MSENVKAPGHDEKEPDSNAWGGTGYVRQELDPALVAWWQSLPIPTRTTLAASRGMTGMPCPEVVVVEDGRRVRRRIASRDVVAGVLRVRLNHSERRLV